MNKDVWGVIDTTSNVLGEADNVKKLDTSVQSSMIQERNLELLQNDEESLKSIFPELGTKLDTRVRVNLTKTVVRKSPKFKRLGHPPVETKDIPNLDYISAIRPKNCNGLRKITYADNIPGYTHDFKNMSETTAFRKYNKNSEIATIEVFERETSSSENIQQTLTMNIVTRKYNNQLTRSTDSSKHEELYKQEVNLDPEPSSSDLSETSSNQQQRK